jgi:hypothetical protein
VRFPGIVVLCLLVATTVPAAAAQTVAVPPSPALSSAALPLDPHAKRMLVLFYGDPRNPSGIDADQNSARSYHPIGEPCNRLYAPSTGAFATGPGDVGECPAAPSAADLAVQRFKHACGPAQGASRRYGTSFELTRNVRLGSHARHGGHGEWWLRAVVVETKGELVAYFNHAAGARSAERGAAERC